MTFATPLVDLRAVLIARVGPSRACVRCHVPDGTYGGYWEQKPRRWDVAGGIALGRAAGGRVSEYDGGKGSMASGHVVAQLAAPDAIGELVKVGRVRDQTRWMDDILGDPAVTGAVIVAAPEEMPVSETLELAGLVWFQGWNDMCDSKAIPVYEANLVHFVNDVRRDLARPGLPIVIGEPGNGGPHAPPEKGGTPHAPNPDPAPPRLAGPVPLRATAHTHDHPQQLDRPGRIT